MGVWTNYDVVVKQVSHNTNEQLPRIWSSISFSLFTLENTNLIILFTQPLRSGRIWHKVNF